MGYGGYSYSERSKRVRAAGWDTKSSTEIFSRNFNLSMSPIGIENRESRDSEEHPESVPIIIALDVTGSMGHIPHYLVQEGLPHIVQTIIDEGIEHPQILFLGIGDHECDRAPLQVGQFESSDELLDKWLTDLFIEGGGGGNDGESYLLAWLFASRYTSTDHWDKRQKKGLLFTIGDEKTLLRVPASAQKSILGNGQYKDVTVKELLEEVQQRYETFHLHLLEGYNGKRKEVQSSWEDLLGNHVIYIQSKEQVPEAIASNIIEVTKEQTPASPSLERFDDIGE